MKVNGKHPTWGTRRPQTLWPIDLRFDVGDYVGGMTQHAKNCENRPCRAARHRGEILCSMFFIYIYTFLVTSCQALENTFLGVAPPFLCQTTWFGEDWFSRGVLTSTPKFSPPKPPKNVKFFTRFLDLENFRPKRCIMGRLINKLPLIVTSAP